MARHKDVNWSVEEKYPGTHGAALCVLMDIRDELKALNSHLRCYNFVRIPTVLDRIDTNTKKRKYVRKAKGA
jgi:hypothetical protein